MTTPVSADDEVSRLPLPRRPGDCVCGSEGVAEGEEKFGGLERRGAQTETVERRQHPRYAVDAVAEVLVLDGSLLFRGRVLDISLAGCYIETRARLQMRQRTPVEMIFRVKDSMFRLHATSRMVRPGMGAGFLFSEMNERTRMALDALIAELTAGSLGQTAC